MSRLVQALRGLRRSPVLTTVAVLSLGLGIGANTAVFSLFTQIVRQPLPVAAPDELVNLASPGMRNGSVSCGISGSCDTVFSYPMYRALSADPHVFTGIAAHHLFAANVGYQDATLPVDAMEVSGNYFDLLGLAPTRGRLIAAADTASAGSARVAVLSFDYWVTRFGHTDAILNQSLTVNGQALTVVGVAPAGFSGTTRGANVRMFVPITLAGLLEPPFDGFDRPDEYWTYLFARRRAGVSIAAAESGINVPYHGLLSTLEVPTQRGLSPADQARFAARRILLEDGRRGQSYLLARAASPLTVLQAVTAVILLIACANIANLLLARAAGRSGEMAVRLSIGASRWHLVRQLLLEACLLAALGGLAGLVIMDWTSEFMLTKLSFGALDPDVSRLTMGAVAFAAAVSMGTGLLFGLFPALHATRPDLAATLKGQAGQPSRARTAARFRAALVVMQIALSMGLLTAAGLFTRSLRNVTLVDLGVRIDHVVTFNLNPRRNGFTPVRAQQLFADVLTRLSALPGVTSVSAARVPLIAGSTSSTGIAIEGYTPAPGESMGVKYNEIAPAYFRTIGEPLLAGRDLTEADVAGAPRVALVNEAFAKRFQLGHNPVGHRMRRGSGPAFDIEIVGLVGDAKYNNVRDANPPVFYTPYRQNDGLAAINFYAAVAGDPEQALSAIRPLVAALDSALPVEGLETMPQAVAETLKSDRDASTLSALFAALATVLAAIGIYGVLAYTVSLRTREFGLRMALGAGPAMVQRLVLRQVLSMTLGGGLLGLALGVGAGRLARAELFGLGSTDPVALIGASLALAVVALGAGLLPSIRASRVDPMLALRAD